MNSAKADTFAQNDAPQNGEDADEPGETHSPHGESKAANDSKPGLPMVIPQSSEENEPKTSFFGWLKSIFSRSDEKNSENAGLAAVLAVDENMDFDFSPEERDMLGSILRLRNMKVQDVMVARAEIQAVDKHITVGEILKEFEKSGHSRMPVYDDGLDDPKGMIHIRDVLAHITKTAHVTRAEAEKSKTPFPANLSLRKVNLSRSIEKLNLIRPVLFVPRSMAAMDLMGRMQANRLQMALVIDEYGGTDGLVCMEDIVEIIVGDIEDEHDEDDSHMIVDKGDGSFLVDARVELDDLQDAMGMKFDFKELSEDIDTIGGVVFALISRVPVRGEVIEAAGYEMRIVAADPRRIKTIEIVPSNPRGVKR